MNIGQAAEASGVSSKMIRYYEQSGLIPKARRSENGYRVYDDTDIHRLRFIRRSRNLGFTVVQMRELLALWSDRSRASADVKALALGHVETLKERLAEIENMIATLETLAEHCQGDNRPDCPIISGLAEEGEHSESPPKVTQPRFGKAADLRA